MVYFIVGDEKSRYVVKKSYVNGGSHVTALTGVDLDLSSGESVAIVGVSGCGKTTLLNLLGGVDVPD